MTLGAGVATLLDSGAIHGAVVAAVPVKALLPGLNNAPAGTGWPRSCAA